jgi:hypothetical protein
VEIYRVVDNVRTWEVSVDEHIMFEESGRLYMAGRGSAIKLS